MNLLTNLAEKYLRELVELLSSMNIAMMTPEKLVIHKKQDDSTVTNIDLLIEKKTIELSLNYFPNLNFLSEEGFPTWSDFEFDENKWLCVIDPLDGTSNFISSKGEYSTNVSIFKGKQHICSVVFFHRTKQYRSLIGNTFTSSHWINQSQQTNRGHVIASTLAKKHIQKLRSKYSNSVFSWNCGTYEYLNFPKNDNEFIFVWELYPWDHIAPERILRDMGLISMFLDGSHYGPETLNNKGLLITKTLSDWQKHSEYLLQVLS